MKIENRYIYSIETNEKGFKYIHLYANIYPRDMNRIDEGYVVAEYTFLYFTIAGIHSVIKDDVFHEFTNEEVEYIDYVSKKEGENICLTYHNGKSGTELDLMDITQETPCGDYWCEF